MWFNKNVTIINVTLKCLNIIDMIYLKDDILSSLGSILQSCFVFLIVGLGIMSFRASLFIAFVQKVSLRSLDETSGLF